MTISDRADWDLTRTRGERNPCVGSRSIRIACVLRIGPDTEIAGKEGVHIGFGEADDLGREFDEGQAALLHQVVNRAHTD